MTPNARLRLVDRLEGEVTLPESEDVVLPKYPGGRDADPNERGTRRQQLSIWMSSPENPYLARAAVNRVWSMLFGRGLVNPVDDLGPHNPASHPQLLEDLTNYFVETNYDLKNLLRVLVQHRRVRSHEPDRPRSETSCRTIRCDGGESPNR